MKSTTKKVVKQKEPIKLPQQKEPVKIRGRKLSDGSTQLYLDTYYHGKRTYEFLGRGFRLVPDRTGEDKTKNKEVWRKVLELRSQRIFELDDAGPGIRKRHVLLCAVISKCIKQREDAGQKSRAIAFDMMNRYLKLYLGDNNYYRTELSAVDSSFCEGFITFLVGFKNKNNKPLKKSTANVYFSAFCSMLNYAVRKNYINVSPANQIDAAARKKLRSDSDRRVFLTAEEVRQLENTPIRDNNIKRAFLFSCATGLRLSDVKQLTWGNIKQDTIQTRMQKTGEKITIPLNDTARREMGKRAGKDDLVFNLVKSSETITNTVVRWGERAGLTKHISFHTARHTFATLILPHSDIYTVSKLLGHASISTTQIYADILDESKRKATNAIDSLGI